MADTASPAPTAPMTVLVATPEAAEARRLARIANAPVVRARIAARKAAERAEDDARQAAWNAKVAEGKAAARRARGPRTR